MKFARFVFIGAARIGTIDVQAAMPDLLLAILFIAAFAKTRARSTTAHHG